MPGPFTPVHVDNPCLLLFWSLVVLFGGVMVMLTIKAFFSQGHK